MRKAQKTKSFLFIIDSQRESEKSKLNAVAAQNRGRYRAFDSNASRVRFALCFPKNTAKNRPAEIKRRKQ